MTSKLQTLAAGMRQSVSQHDTGRAAAILPGGLQVVLSCQFGDIWCLSLRREQVYPTATEAHILTEAFAVPNGIENRKCRSWHDRHPKTARDVRWCAVEFTWREVPESAPAADSGHESIGATTA